MKAIVGLGNPQKTYSQTRHNVGFRVIDRLAAHYKVNFENAVQQKAWIGRLSNQAGCFLLVKPKTYMNNSGLCVSKVLNEYKIPASDLLVVYDDADLDLGFIRLREKGSSAGHKGIASVMRFLGTQDVGRLRIGIGRINRGGLADYVLSEFSQKEEKEIDKVIREAAKISLEWFEERKEKTLKVA